MPQTLLGLLALVLASLVSFNQQRLTSQSYRTMVKNELEIAASGTAMHVMEMVAARSFDEASTPAAIRAAGDIPTQDNQFSAGNTFGAGDRGNAGCDLMAPVQTPNCDDVDDVAGMGWQAVSAQLSNGGELPFEVRLEAYYVETPGSTTPSAVPTRHKHVELVMRSLLLPEQPNGFMTLARVISYDPVKAELDYEAIYGALGS